ncbi:MAG: hypothetical protein FD126_446 [Elusimicrobia bacterium]|nr:MAG: hypothetical protein FD126_446 [Elusimicrobiota bacterium]
MKSKVLAAAAALAATGAVGHEGHKHVMTAAGQAVDGSVVKVLERYRAAFEARSTDKLGEVLDPAVLVLEGTGKNVGWPDYRDNHIGPEMKGWESLTYSDPVIVDAGATAEQAWAVTQATVTIVEAGKPLTLDVAETFVLGLRDGVWRIRHLHWSGKRRTK